MLEEEHAYHVHVAKAFLPIVPHHNCHNHKVHVSLIVLILIMVVDKVWFHFTLQYSRIEEKSKQNSARTKSSSRDNSREKIENV